MDSNPSRAQKRRVDGAISKAKKRLKKIKHDCLYPNCGKKAIRSHSQQANKALKSISVNGEVYCARKSLPQGDQPFDIVYVPKPISTATRFDGFCSTHDTKIFDPIENHEIDSKNEYHLFLLYLRAICHEYCTRRHWYYLMQYWFESGKDFIGGELADRLSNLDYERSEQLEKAGGVLLKDAFSRLSNEDYQLDSRVYEIQANLGLSCASTLPVDSKNRDLSRQQISSKLWPFISFSVVPSNKKTIVAYSSLPIFNEETKAFYQEITDETLGNLINVHAFTESEDTCISPKLWDQLNESEQEILNHHALSAGSHDVDEETPIVVKLPELIAD